MHALIEEHGLRGQLRWVKAEKNRVRNGELVRAAFDCLLFFRVQFGGAAPGRCRVNFLTTAASPPAPQYRYVADSRGAFVQPALYVSSAASLVG